MNKEESEPQSAGDLLKITDSLTPEARKHLVPMLGEVFNVLDNLPAICDCGLEKPGCRKYLRLPKLRQLLVALNGSPGS